MTNYNRNKISSLVSENLPDFVSQDHPKFVTFVEEYYKWLESQENSYFAPLSLSGLVDIDKTVNDFVDYFKTYIFPKFPERYVSAKGDELDVRSVLKKVRSFYQSKGTEESIKFLIRLLFDVYSEIYVPSEDIFVTSGGRWYQPSIVRCIDSNPLRNSKLRNLQVTFHNRDGERVASGRIGDIKQFYKNGKQIVEFDIFQLIGNVPYPGTIQTKTPEGEQVSINLISMVSSISVGSAGRNYQPDDPITIETLSGFNGVGSKASVESVTNEGAIRSVRIDDPGLFYFPINNLYVQYSISITSETGTGADNFVISTSPLVKRPGVYQNNDGQLSSTEKIQDNYRYQKHSYVVRTEANLPEYENTLKDLVHPAGKLLIGDYLVYRTDSITTDAPQYVLQTQYEPLFANYFPYTIAEVSDGATTEVGVLGVLPSDFDLRGISTDGLNNSTAIPPVYRDYFPFGYDGSTGYFITDQQSERTIKGDGISFGSEIQDINRFGGIGATQEFFARVDVDEYVGTTLPGWPSDGTDFWIVHPHPNTWHGNVESGVTWGGIVLGDFIRSSYRLTSPPVPESQGILRGFPLGDDGKPKLISVKIK